MQQSVRRVITTIDKDGKSTILSDAPATNVVKPIAVAPDLALINLWATDASPADLSDHKDPTAKPMPLCPPPAGTILRFVDFPPDASYLHKLDLAAMQAAWDKLETKQENSKVHPMMHATKTIDYAIVLTGEIHLILDKTETLVKAGDVVMQRATNHAWANRSDLPCRVAFILIDAK